MLSLNHLFLTILILFISLSGRLIGQDYSPLVIEGATWINWYSVEDYTQTGYWAHRIEGDSVYNNLIYSKIYTYQLDSNQTSPFKIVSKKFIGLIREVVADKKIYVIMDSYSFEDCEGFDPFSSGEEVLIFDFNLEIGDSFNCLVEEYDKGVLIENILIEERFGADRRIFVTENGLELIEGIGFEDGLFQLGSSIVHASWGYGLYDYCLSQNADCELSTSTKFLDLIDFNAYPNPVGDWLNVDSILGKNLYFSLISNQGQIVKSGKLDRNIYLGDLPVGVYWLEVYSELHTGKMSGERIVVSR